jgi:hypothetical protein
MEISRVAENTLWINQNCSIPVLIEGISCALYVLEKDAGTPFVVNFSRASGRKEQVFNFIVDG